MRLPIAIIVWTMALAACWAQETEVQRTLADGCAGARPLSDLPAPLDVQLAAYVARPEFNMAGISIRAIRHTGGTRNVAILPLDNRSVPDLQGRELVFLFVGCGNMQPGEMWMGEPLAVTVDRATGDIQTVGIVQ